MGVFIDVIDTAGVKRTGTSDQAVDFIAFGHQELSQVTTVLPSDTSDQSFAHRVIPVVERSRPVLNLVEMLASHVHHCSCTEADHELPSHPICLCATSCHRGWRRDLGGGSIPGNASHIRMHGESVHVRRGRTSQVWRLVCTCGCEHPHHTQGRGLKENRGLTAAAVL